MEEEKQATRLHMDIRDAEKMIKRRVCSDCWGDLQLTEVYTGGQFIDTADVFCPTEGCLFRGTISTMTRALLIETSKSRLRDFKYYLWKTNPDIYRKIFDDTDWMKWSCSKEGVEQLTKDIFG